MAKIKGWKKSGDNVWISRDGKIVEIIKTNVAGYQVQVFMKNQYADTVRVLNRYPLKNVENARKVAINYIKQHPVHNNTEKIGVDKIYIYRAEGPPGLTGFWKTFDSFSDANQYLRRSANTMPRDQLGYDKFDFVVIWKDGRRHEGRLDVTPRGDDTNVGQHVKTYYEHLIENRGFFGLTREEEEQARKMLSNYKFQD